MVHETLDVQLVGVVVLEVCLLLLASATVSPTFGMTTSCILSLCLLMSFMLEVRQGLYLCDGFVYGLDLIPLQLRLGLILQSVNEVGKNVFIRKVGNLKC